MRRARLREQRDTANLIAAHEKAGDRARNHHLYADAAQWYHRALDMQQIASIDRLRITEKLKKAYFLGENPSAATPLADWLANSYLAFADGSAKAVESLIDVATQLSIDSKTKQTLPALAQAAKIAEGAGLTKMRVVVDLQRVRHLHTLDRDDEARLLLATVAVPSEHEDPALCTVYYREKGHAAAVLGDVDEMHRSFRLALGAAKESPDAYSLTHTWGTYAFAAWRLGNIEHAKNCFESAILVAREHQILWRVSRLYAFYADLLVTMGRYAAARKYLLEALEYQAPAPSLEVNFVRVGIPLALKLKDAALLERCEQSASIEETLQDGNPTNIGSVIAGFAQIWASRGEHRRARAMLHRALPYMQQLAWNWDFLLTVAQHGARTDVPHARKLFEQVITRPHAYVARACLSLFDAFIAYRNREDDPLRAHAADAVQRFEALHWYRYAEAARDLTGDSCDALNRREIEGLPLTNVDPALTLRERQVAELVLQGMTNRIIAAELGISEHTVESHMTAILSRLGIKSRHQLTERLAISIE